MTNNMLKSENEYSYNRKKGPLSSQGLSLFNTVGFDNELNTSVHIIA